MLASCMLAEFSVVKGSASRQLTYISYMDVPSNALEIHGLEGDLSPETESYQLPPAFPEWRALRQGRSQVWDSVVLPSVACAPPLVAGEAVPAHPQRPS